VAAFRFALQVSKADSPEAWRGLARKAEDLGYSTLYVPDHLDDQWSPMVACAVAAEATTTLRVGTLVLDNDFRHPVLVAKEAATLDILTDGRFEFGLGAGWMTTDYEQSGIPMDVPSVRIGRLEESLEIIRAMWRDGSATFAGEHYDVRDVVGSPTPVTPGGPPIVIGGGSKRILTLASEQADIVGVTTSMATGELGGDVASQATIEHYERCLGWIREGAGHRFDSLELQITPSIMVVSSSRAAKRSASMLGFPGEDALDLPILLIGTEDELCERLVERREKYGFSNIVVGDQSMEAFAPIVARLAGS
jgi:probable F420-dependent oxidoreductase